MAAVYVHIGLQQAITRGLEARISNNRAKIAEISQRLDIHRCKNCDCAILKSEGPYCKPCVIKAEEIYG